MIHYIKEAGCVEADDKAYPGNSQLYTSKGKDWIARTNAHLKTFIPQTLQGIVSLGGVEGMTTQEEADELSALAEKELTGRKIHYLFVRAWGRKPEAS
jgi:fructose-bisphosphate aldolase class 1